MTDSRHFSPKTKREAYKRSHGHCEKCTAKLWTGRTRYDHIIPWDISQDSSPENCQVLCLSCDASKTYGQDIPTIAKVHRLYDRTIDIEHPRKKLPGHKKDWVSKKVCGTVVPRLPRYGKHHQTMAGRYPSEGRQ